MGLAGCLLVILIVSLLSFGFRYLQRGPPEALRLAWAILGLMTVLAGLVVTLVLELPLSEDLATAREVAFDAYPCAPLGALEAPRLGW